MVNHHQSPMIHARSHPSRDAEAPVVSPELETQSSFGVFDKLRAKAILFDDNAAKYSLRSSSTGRTMGMTFSNISHSLSSASGDVKEALSKTLSIFQLDPSRNGSGEAACDEIEAGYLELERASEEEEEEEVMFHDDTNLFLIGDARDQLGNEMRDDMVDAPLNLFDIDLNTATDDALPEAYDLHRLESPSSDDSYSEQGSPDNASREFSLLDAIESGDEESIGLDEERDKSVNDHADTPESRDSAAFEDFPEEDTLAALGQVIQNIAECNFLDLKDDSFDDLSYDGDHDNTEELLAAAKTSQSVPIEAHKLEKEAATLDGALYTKQPKQQGRPLEAATKNSFPSLFQANEPQRRYQGNGTFLDAMFSCFG